MKVKLTMEEWDPKTITINDLTIFTSDRIEWSHEFFRQLLLAKPSPDIHWGLPVDTSPHAEYDSFSKKTDESMNPNLTRHLEKIFGVTYKRRADGSWFFDNSNDRHWLPADWCNYIYRRWRTLYLLLKHELRPGMDQWIHLVNPEDGLPLNKQQDIARFIAHLVNAGYKVLLFTHADTIMVELSILMALTRKSKGVQKILEEQPDERKENLLDHHRVAAYDMNDGKLRPSKVLIDCIAVESMDKTIRDIHQIRFDLLRQ